MQDHKSLQLQDEETPLWVPSDTPTHHTLTNPPHSELVPLTLLSELCSQKCQKTVGAGWTKQNSDSWNWLNYQSKHQVMVLPSWSGVKDVGFCQVHCSINYAMIHCPRTTCDGVSTKSVSSQNDPKEQIRWSLHITWMRCPNSWNKVLTSSWEIVEGISAVEGGKLQIMHATGNYK